MQPHRKRHAWVLGVGLAGVIALGSTWSLAQQQPEGEHQVTLAEQLEWTPASPVLPPGAEVAVLEGEFAAGELTLWRLRVPAGYQIAPHRHSAVERVTVLSGAALVGMGEQFDDTNMTPLGPGDHFRVEPQHAHYVRFEETTVVQLTTLGEWDLIYVNPADDPRATGDWPGGEPEEPLAPPDPF